MIRTKPLGTMFNKIDGFIRAYNLTKYLILPRPEKYDTVFNKSRYPIALKSSGPYVDCFNYGKIKIDSDDDLTLAKHYLCIMLS